MRQASARIRGTWTAALAIAFLALWPGVTQAELVYEDEGHHNRYFGSADYGVRAESMAYVMRDSLLGIMRTVGGEVAHRDTVRLFGRNTTAFHANVATFARQVIGIPATGRVAATASFLDGRYTYTPFDANLSEGVEVSPSRSYNREVLSWGQTFWVGFLPVRLDVSVGGAFEVYARRTRVTSGGFTPTVRTTLGASAAMTGRGFAGLGADFVVLNGHAGVELRLTLANLALESPCSLGWAAVDMPVNLRFSNRLRIALTAEGCVFNPFDWDDLESCVSGSVTLVDYTFAEQTWLLMRFVAR